MYEIECPYCEHEFDLNHDDGAFYDEEHRREEECPNCEKKFMVTSSMSWNFEGEKADCLNDGNHNWKKKYNPKYYPQLIHREICEDCDEERTLPTESIKGI